MREIKFSQALSEGMVQEMETNPDIFITGIAVDYPSGIFGSTTEALRRFGSSRVFDAPAMENALSDRQGAGQADPGAGRVVESLQEQES